MPDIALVNMPFCSARAPSLQLGLLKALCARENIATDAFHLNLDFAATVGPDLYELLSGTPTPMLGEWTFTKAAFPEFETPPAYLAQARDFVRQIEQASGVTEAGLLTLREDLAPDFVRAAAKPLAAYKVVGITSTFQQNVPSLALAMEIKRRNPDTTIVFGGANVEGSVGAALLEAFDCIDVIVNGECNSFVADLFGALLRDEPLDRFASVRTRQAPGTGAERGTYAGNMDDLPVPDYSDFFARRAELGLDTARPGQPSLYGPGSEYVTFLPFESSRGCWWGQKHHCTFCGLNAGGMTYRARSNEATVDLIEELHRKHDVSLLYSVDNILNAKGMDRFFELLLARGLDLDIFYEIKSNMKPGSIEKMAAAGIRYVQPGIESFSDHVLQLMGKGVSALHNLNTLRWLRSCDVRVAWNILCGFPGETRADYAGQLALVKKIHHLQPPTRANRIRIDRQSPNFFDPKLREMFGELRHLEGYSYIYPDHVDRNAAAHYFYPAVNPPTAIGDDDIAALNAEVDIWNSKWRFRGDALGVVTAQGGGGEVPFLRYRRAGGGAGRIEDGREDPERPRTIALSPLEACAYEHMLYGPRERDSNSRLGCARRPCRRAAGGRLRPLREAGADPRDRNQAAGAGDHRHCGRCLAARGNHAGVIGASAATSGMRAPAC